MDLNKRIEERINYINNGLDKYLTPEYPEIIYEAMRYSVFAGGKRVRPVFLLSVCEAVGGNLEKALPFACALEMIHTYSLIHDDLPAMDNDDFRRGKKTCHKMFDEGIAVLAGDGLLNMAFEIMLDSVCKDPKLAYAAKTIADLSGSKGMLVGQVADVTSENKPIDEKTLMFIHENKTAGLIKAALGAGAIIGGADEKKVNNFLEIGYKIGIAFQIQDDILDVTSTDEVLGKPVFSDEKNNKTTYVTMFGLNKAKADYIDYFRNAAEAVKDLAGEGFLYKYTQSLISRKF